LLPRADIDAVQYGGVDWQSMQATIYCCCGNLFVRQQAFSATGTPRAISFKEHWSCNRVFGGDMQTSSILRCSAFEFK
jgi:hypothetical protein